MKLQILASPGRKFITSDWPCFDMKDSPDSPLLGEKIGRNPAVVRYLPLTPQFGAIFFTADFSATASRGPRARREPTDRRRREESGLTSKEGLLRYILMARMKAADALLDGPWPRSSNGQGRRLWSSVAAGQATATVLRPDFGAPCVAKNSAAEAAADDALRPRTASLKCILLAFAVTRDLVTLWEIEEYIAVDGYPTLASHATSAISVASPL